MIDMLAELRTSHGSRILGAEHGSPRQTFVTVSDSDAPTIARHISEKMGGRLVTITGLDTPDGIELLYHFAFDANHSLLTLKTRVKKPDPRILSLAPHLPGAEWIEREIHDLLGVVFEGHPRLERLILADDWPAGVHPLRKDEQQ